MEIIEVTYSANIYVLGCGNLEFRIGDRVLAYPGYNSDWMLWEEGTLHEGIIVNFRPSFVLVRFTKRRLWLWKVNKNIWIRELYLHTRLTTREDEVSELEKMLRLTTSDTR